MYLENFGQTAQAFDKAIALPDAAQGMYYVKPQAGTVSRTAKMIIR